MIKKVLVVENDQKIREILSFTLARAGFDVIAVETGEEAFGEVEGSDVVLLDLRLPKMSGEDFLRMIREGGNYVPVVVMSGVYSKEDVEKRLKGFDIVDFVPKPFSTLEILEKVNKAVRISDSMGCIRRGTDLVKNFIEKRART